MIHQTRIAVSIPESLNMDLAQYLVKRSKDGKLHGMKKMFYIVAIMEKLEWVGMLSSKAKNDCKKIMEDARLEL